MNVNKTVRGSLALIRAIFSRQVGFALIRAIFSRQVGFWTLLAICASLPGTLAFWFISGSNLMGVSFIALFLFASLFFIIAVPRIESEQDKNNANRGHFYKEGVK